MTLAVKTLLALQCFHVLFLVLHDWVPLGALNDIRAVRAQDSRARLLTVTVVSTAPFAAVLIASALHPRHFPDWLLLWLFISYTLLFVGELRAWWIPFAFGTTPERVARYHAMFGKTYALFPEHNGIRINTLHLVLHLATLAMVLLVALLLFR